MENEILQQILTRFDKFEQNIHNEIKELKQGQAKLEQGQAKLEQGQNEINERLNKLETAQSKTHEMATETHNNLIRLENTLLPKINSIYDALSATEGVIKFKHEPRIIKLENNVENLKTEVMAIKIKQAQ